MKGRESRDPPSADLLVCFPSRAHLTLMPKPICSPAKPSEPNKRHHRHHHQRKLSNRGGGTGQASPLMWSKTKPMGSDISEPTSPKVTCAGQIRVQPSPCKNWQSVMEEIEKIHHSKNKKKPNWVESLGFKKDTLQLLTCLRRIRVNFRCFRSYPASDLTSDEEDDENCKEEQVGVDEFEGNDNSKATFSKWFMVLQEESREREKSKSHNEDEEEEEVVVAECRPPPNALLLMRCRSAPAKSWLEERQREEEKGKLGMGLEEIRRSNRLEVVMRYDTDFYKLSSDVAKETWVVGDLRDQLSRRRSWKR
ncbi:Translation initiation factor IF-2 like [Actinidia chinensis var. chinensis]|uniref:Translation initiation factor IF-2 like n=1 Tax=Actinidia chinensis var. chinensis TaxID=1590841 RepID=A0A2R6Q0P8_ACTCC|nr:Translation initiation factor IF-2 like [Actinidia chinensis var. chinensis]